MDKQTLEGVAAARLDYAAISMESAAAALVDIGEHQHAAEIHGAVAMLRRWERELRKIHDRKQREGE